jgi:exodeoxyribonuclease V alpha subunit
VPGLHINNNDHKGLTACLDGQYADLHFHDPGMGAGEEWLRQQIIDGYAPLLAARTIQDAFTVLDSFRILCALRQGNLGVAGANALCRTTLIRAGLLDDQPGPTQGQPLIIRQNHYHLGLFNGDTGIFWPDEQGRIMAWFPGQDNCPRAIAPARLPAHAPAWSITVHKAQGSEFDRVLLMLPEAESRILSRELLYTAVTRAKRELALFGSRETVARAMAQPIRRYSGLADLLS